MDRKIVNLKEVRARAAGESPAMAEVITQLNEHFGTQIAPEDPRLHRFRRLFPVLNAAAEQQEDVCYGHPDHQTAFAEGLELGRALMLKAIVLQLLAEDGLHLREL